MIVATTTVVNAQSLTTGGITQLTQTTANAATSGYIYSIRLNAGAAMHDPSKRIRLFYTSSPYNISTTGNASQIALQETARWLEVQWGERNPGADIVFDSSLEILTGGYIYSWLQQPTFTSAVTYTLTLIELS